MRRFQWTETQLFRSLPPSCSLPPSLLLPPSLPPSLPGTVVPSPAGSDHFPRPRCLGSHGLPGAGAAYGPGVQVWHQVSGVPEVGLTSGPGVPGVGLGGPGIGFGVGSRGFQGSGIRSEGPRDGSSIRSRGGSGVRSGAHGGLSLGAGVPGMVPVLGLWVPGVGLASGLGLGPTLGTTQHKWRNTLFSGGVGRPTPWITLTP